MSPILRFAWLCRILVGPLALSAAAPVLAEEVDFGFREVLLAKVPKGLRVKTPTHPPIFHRGHVAYVARYAAGGQIRECAVLDDRRGPEFVHVSRLYLSPDGSKLVYFATLQTIEGHPAYVVVGDRWDELQPPGGSTSYDDTWMPVFDGNGTKLAYKRERWVSSGSLKQEIVVVNLDFPFVFPGKEATLQPLVGKVGPEFDWVGRPALSPDGSTVAYAARVQGKLFVVSHGEAGPEFDKAGDMIFNSDGSRLAYMADDYTGASIVVNHVRGPTFDEVYEPNFSPDGSRIVYPAREGYKAFIVLGDVKRETVRFYDEVLFSADGTKLAFWAFGGNRRYLIVSARQLPEFHSVGWPVFHPDLRTFAYRVQDGKKFRIVVGTHKGPRFDDIGLHSGPYDKPAVVFSPDGRKVGYGALKGDELWWKILEAPLPAFEIGQSCEAFLR